MIDGIPLAWPSLGATGLLALAVILVLTGRLVPRSTLRDMRDERDKWKAAHDVSAEQVTRMLSEEQTSTAVMRSIEGFIRERRHNP